MRVRASCVAESPYLLNGVLLVELGLELREERLVVEDRLDGRDREGELGESQHCDA